ncbi:CRISPR-associated endonuclease Cas3'' [Halobacterium salinarum]|uniref:CRISPR-associated endonuclease Cas3'' n=1 Tax=Halobacterium salinarum TaxID=2242 RepID=UPI002557BCD2|nr:CRISPR-associated endonuclease Cas3'' [Halobacterium salinarum]MDL0134573.1 CRISPR-associated endonuclease Cas3'' [Halobacterium salinarum]
MTLDSSQRYSHPPRDGGDGRLLLDHLRDVATRVDHIVPVHATTPNGEPLRDVVRRLALVHDLGKATTWFQKYIDEDRSDPSNNALRYHAPLGSFAAYYILDDAGYEAETCLAGFVAVAKHHGRLPDVLGYVYDRTTGDRRGNGERIAALKKQVVDINDEAVGLAEAVFADAAGDADAWLAFARSLLGDTPESLVDQLSGLVSRNGQEARETVSDSCYALVLRCWSALVFADKTSAAQAPSGQETYAAEIPALDRLDEYIDGLDSDPNPDGTDSQRLDYCRNRARQSVLTASSEFAQSGSGIATLTLPTGMGKTLTGLSAAFTIRDALDGERVVYALPFTSIIDQVVAELETIYETDGFGRLLTAHHHLETAEIRDQAGDWNVADATDQMDDTASMLGEAWRAGLTVTTFVQLFESLAGPRNTQSMKLPALQDSVVVLDEPQSLPLDWWKLAPRLARILVDQYDATVIAMTATQPRLFENTLGDIPELVDDDYDYFDAVERVVYEFDESAERYIESQSEPKSYADAASRLRDTAGNESILAVANTIDSARKLTETVANGGTFVDIGDVYTGLLEELDHGMDASDIEPATVANAVLDMDGRPLLHLSTRLRPVDRLTLIETARELTDTNCALVVVSTQLIEAGVDISFDRVYRDFAPLDSIVQAAGRCNRSFEREQGRVTVWWLAAPDEESETTPAGAVYNRGANLLPVTADAIEAVRDRVDTLDETALAKTAVEEYYERLGPEARDVGKRAYVDFVDNAHADELGQLSLIDQRRSVDVLVTRTAGERDLAEALLEADRTYDYDELDRLRDAIKPFTVSVPLYYGDDETEDAVGRLTPLRSEDGLYWLDVQRHEEYFDQTKGFVVPESTVDHQFL